MAGGYPDVPSWRFAYDRDGTEGVTIVSGVPSSMSSAELIKMNNENEDFTLLNGNPQVFIFPEPRDLDGYWVSGIPQYPPLTVYVWTSVDTTNGVDGTWVVQSSGYTGDTGAVSPSYRQTIRSSTVLAIKGVKFVATSGLGSCYIRCVHLFGEIAPTVNPNRLVLWHPTSNAHIVPAYFDWGNVPRSSSQSRTFRVKNNSSTLTANSIRVAMDDLTDTTPSVVGQHTLSTDGSTFLAQVNIGNLAPGAISAPITLLRVTPSNAVLSVWCHRVFAEAATWS